MQVSINKLILVTALLAGLLVVALWGIWPPAPEGESPSTRVTLDPRDVVLYFSDAKGLTLVSEERTLPGCNEERQCIAQTIEALAKGSDRLMPVIPPQTRVLGVEIAGDLCQLDFSRELVDRHPGGSMSELLTVYGLTNTLAVNFPQLHRLQILVEGQKIPTLKGHVDTSAPIKAEFKYSYLPPDGEEATDER